jgi:hypothetical protein
MLALCLLLLSSTAALNVTEITQVIGNMTCAPTTTAKIFYPADTSQTYPVLSFAHVSLQR